MTATAHDLAATAWTALGGEAAALDALAFTGAGALPSPYAVTDMAAASVGVMGLALSGFRRANGGNARPAVRVDRRLASFWFDASLRPRGWQVAAKWDAIAGDYAAADGWVRLHTNAPHHRAAAERVLGARGDRDAVARAVSRWNAGALETAIVAAGGCAAAMRPPEAWAAHPQGRAVGSEPLVHLRAHPAPRGDNRSAPPAPADRPLAGVRVLDLTRVLAGPTASRALAGYGADVLRIDPPHWEEPALVPEMTLGKRCARLDLRRAGDRATFERLLAGADVLLHGYRNGALDGLGYGAGMRRSIRPGLVEVALDAYGWTGPWAGRRGFDSLVQMSTGLAELGMRRGGAARPVPLPVQALDYGTGYLMAAAAIGGLARRRTTGAGTEARASLARTAAWLISAGTGHGGAPPLAPETPDDLAPRVERTAWGEARRPHPPLFVEGSPMRWDVPAGPLGSGAAVWR